MNKKVLIAAGSIVVLILILLFYFTQSDSKRKYYDWNETFLVDSKSPYDQYIFYELLKNSYNKDFNTINDASIKYELNSNDSTSIYMIVGESAFYTYDDIESLKQFVADGNEAFICLKNFPYDLLDEINYDQYCAIALSTITYDTIEASIKDSNIKLSYPAINNLKPYERDWPTLDTVDYCYDNIEVLGYYNNSEINLLKISYGKGVLYLHSDPILFTNYYLTHEEYLPYAEGVMGIFNGNQIVWDEFSKMPPEKESAQKKNPLEFILSQPSLRWAWYTLLLAVFIYFLFYIKRKQRIIPVIAKNRNTTLEYVETIGYLYYKEQNHRNLAEHKWNLFLADIRTRYNLPTNHVNKEFITKLSLKSGIEVKEIEKIIKEYQDIDYKVDITPENLISFHQLVEHYYQRRK